MSAPQNVIAVIFDFDDTLTDESTTGLLEAHGIDSGDFWGQRNQALLEQGWDPGLSYLKLILDEARDGGKLAGLSNKKLRDFGAHLDFYPGIPEVFDDLKRLVSEHQISHPSVEFFIISSGLEDVIKGTKIAAYFSGIWGCNFHEEKGVIVSIKNAVSFTEKTKFLFAINKGLSDIRAKPYGVNEKVADENRRVPFRNMIFIGDGFTDVPCFSLLERSGGKAFGVFDPRKEGSPKKAWEKLVVPKRVTTMNSPKYGTEDDLGSLLRAAVRTICTEMEMRTKTAF